MAFAFGGNHSNSENLLTKAMADVAALLTASKISSIYRTKPLGHASHEYFNSVVLGESSALSLSELWAACQKIEVDLGRQREVEIPWGDRPIDIDFLFYDSKVAIEQDLVIPHPQMHRRNFVLDPLEELFTEWKHPVLGKTITELREDFK